MKEAPAVLDAFKFLDLPQDADLRELDARYFQLTSFWSGHAGGCKQEDAQETQADIDAAYQTLLPFLSDPSGLAPPKPVEKEFTMKQIMCNQDRILLPSASGEDMWGTAPGSEEFPALTTESDDMWEADDETESAPESRLVETTGDIFSAPDRAVIVHAVNCQGVWGSGFAEQLRLALPAAYGVYRAYCKRVSKPYELAGQCLLIPPQSTDYSRHMQYLGEGKELPGQFTEEATLYDKRRWVACLFTSIGYGRARMKSNNPGRCPTSRILNFTEAALESLRVQLEEFASDGETQSTQDDSPGEIWSVKFNSGAFRVPWDRTRRVLVDELRYLDRPWTVVELAKDPNTGSDGDDERAFADRNEDRPRLTLKLSLRGGQT